MADVHVHPTAIVEDGARLAAGVKIGPFCVVGPEVSLGERVELISHVAVAGTTEIGSRHAHVSVRVDRSSAAGSEI